MRTARITNTDGKAVIQQPFTEATCHVFVELPFGITISNRVTGESLDLCAFGEEGKQQWLKEIKRIVNEWVKNNINEMQSKRKSHPRSAPLTPQNDCWQNDNCDSTLDP